MRASKAAALLRGFVLALGLTACAGVEAQQITVPTDRFGVIYGGGVGNHSVGDIGRYQVALRAKAPMAICVNALETYLIIDQTNRAYSKGTGGVISVSLQTLNASGLPSGTVIGTWSNPYNPNLLNGWLRPGQTVAGVQFHKFTFASPACLTSGQSFAMVFRNTHTDPVRNYLGVNSLGRAASGPYDPVWAVYLKSSTGAWVKREWPSTPEYHFPIFRVASADGKAFGNTYMQSSRHNEVGGALGVRQRFTLTTSKTWSQCTILAARKSTADPLTIRIGITPLAAGSSYIVSKDVSITHLTPRTAGWIQEEVTATWSSPVTLQPGSYTLLISSTAPAGAAWIGALQDGSEGVTPNGYFDTVFGLGKLDDYAEKSSNGGTTWTPWLSRQDDLPFNCS
jgi:hypothetical protein